MNSNGSAPIFSALPDSPDARGSSFTIPPALIGELSAVHDVHIASIEPGAVRGNHFHGRKTEIITFSYTSACSFVWDEGEGTEVNRRDFTGQGSVSVVVRPGVSHAVQNTGEERLYLVVMSDAPHDPSAPDAFRRAVVGVQ